MAVGDGDAAFVICHHHFRLGCDFFFFPPCLFIYIKKNKKKKIYFSYCYPILSYPSFVYINVVDDDDDDDDDVVVVVVVVVDVVVVVVVVSIAADAGSVNFFCLFIYLFIIN